MKRLILLAAAAAIVATAPALARSQDKVRHPHARHQVVPGGAYASYGAYGARTSPCVYVNGRYAGCDPDPNVRQSLVNEYYWLHRPFY